MLFNSYIFVFLFLPLSLIGYYILNKYKKYKLAEYFLIIMSLWFYGYFNYKYLLIIVISILVNYYLGKLIQQEKDIKKRKFLLILGCILNVGILFYYKYMNFFLTSINDLFHLNFVTKNILLPLGISFFTFQQLSYVIDNYKNTMKQYSLRQYALFVCFFPQLIAGPIVLHNELVPQFEDEKKKKIDFENLSKGFMAFSFGMAKKVLIADNFGNIVNYGFSNISLLGTTNAIFVMLSYTMQIYFDFSGYCDMATGIGKMFNIDLPMNFNSPYKALTVTDFWKRWHMTLTRFLKTYLYFPLGGNRKGKIRTYFNLFIVFFVSGLWHGANYTFIVWGIMHGIVMVIERIFKDKYSKISPVLSWIITFSFINISWVMFRADSINDAMLFFEQIFDFNFVPLSSAMCDTFQVDILKLIFTYIGSFGLYLLRTYPVYIMILAIFSILFCKNTNERINEFKPTIVNALISSILLFLSIISLSGVSTFLYFNF